VTLTAWGAELLDELAGICELLDAGDPARPYGSTLARQAEKLRDPARTPSARHLQELRGAGGNFAAYTLVLSAQHKARLVAEAGRDAAPQAQFAAEAEASVAEQSAVERAERGSFEEYLARMLDGPASAGGPQ